MEGLRSLLIEADVKPERFDPTRESLCLDAGIMTALEVVRSGVLVEGTSRE